MPIRFVDQQQNQERPELTAGTHKMKVHEVRDGQWPSGDAYVEVSCRVDDGNWLNAKLKPKRTDIARVFAACGLAKPTGEVFDEQAIVGCECSAVLKIRTYQTRDGREGQAYEIDRWIVPGGEAAASVPSSKPINFRPKGPAISTGKVAKPQASAVEADEVDGIPF
jgi:hypothetical protein